MADKFILMKDRYGTLNRCFHRSIRAQENNPDTVKLLEDLWAFPLVMAPSVNTNNPFLEKSKLAEQSEGIWLSCWRKKERIINRNLQTRSISIY